MNEVLRMAGSRPLRAMPGGLALGAPRSAPGTIHALAVSGGISVPPRDGETVLFGRNEPEVHVCVGAGDRGVSRTQGELLHDHGQWWVRSTGQLPVRLPGPRLLFLDDDPVPLEPGYTPLFVRGSRRREHQLELYVTGPDGEQPRTRHNDPTHPPKVWRLTRDERLILVVLGQRYLYREPFPQPLTWRQVVEELSWLRPGVEWNDKQVARVVEAVRVRLSRSGIAGLTREEIGEPLGNTLNHNLIQELMESAALVPRDLRLLNIPDE